MSKLIHAGSGTILADRLEFARTPFERMRGLLGRQGLPPGGGMMIERCSSIHTFFMRFPLDVIFLDSEMVVRKVVRRLKPWRLAGSVGARHVVELPAGATDRAPVAPGEALRIEGQP